MDIMSRGAPIKMARNDVMMLPNIFKYAAQVSRSFMGQVIPARTDKMCYTQREPLGVCALFVSWNGSMVSSAKKLSAALATGNTCIIKAPSLCSLSVLKLAEILRKLDLPKGTINVITGPGGTVGEDLVSHPGVNMISFTGSVETGKRIMSLASNSVKHVGLELGGKNPSIVMEDADIETAVANSMFASFGNSGMTCASTGRYYVQEKIYDKFVDRFVNETRKVVVGDPTDEKTTMGPVIGAGHRDKVEDFIKSGIEQGAKLILGGKRPTNPPLDKGFFVMPTIFTDVTQNMRIAREEIFGPVACFIRFSSEDEVIGLANDTNYGLAAGIWTKDVPRGIRMANEIQSGTVWINGTLLSTEYPWGGYKESGIGKELGLLGLEEYVQTKTIVVDIAKK